MGSLFVAALIIIILVSLFYRSTDEEPKVNQEKEVVAKLRDRYRHALQSGNKEQAVKFGRDYYAYLRNSRHLPAADEQAIAKDVSTMK